MGTETQQLQQQQQKQLQQANIYAVTSSEVRIDDSSALQEGNGGKRPMGFHISLQEHSFGKTLILHDRKIDEVLSLKYSLLPFYWPVVTQHVAGS